MTGELAGIDVGGVPAIEDWIASALEAMEPGRRAALFRELAKDLRRRNQARMGKQTDPQGRRWRRRKPRPVREGAGQIRRAAKMFKGLRQARRLKIVSDADGLTIGWRGENATLALAHHFGGAAVDAIPVPARPLIGLPPDDIRFIRDALLDWLSG